MSQTELATVVFSFTALVLIGTGIGYLFFRRWQAKDLDIKSVERKEGRKIRRP